MTKEIENQVTNATKELLDISGLKKGDIFILGGSSSEVVGGTIGKDSSKEVGQVIIDSIYNILKDKGIYLAVQGCEHINRALVVEEELALQRGLEIVNVVPVLHAGGSLSVAAYEKFEKPVMVEHITADAGIDIGDTEIAMHVRFVQVPVRLKTKMVGQARLTALRSRRKLIGGDRANHY